MKKFYFILLCFFSLKNLLIAQDYKRQWVSVNQDSTADYLALTDMVVDANGNTYMGGYEVDPGEEYYEKHLYISKVNAAGKLEWKHNFNNKKDSIDEAIGIAVDTSGYVYVTGKRIDTFCNICTYNTRISDIVTMKYNPAGKRIWLNRYHDSDYILAAPSDITLSPDGTILITGNETRYVPALGTDISNLLIQKINKNGKTVWIKKMNAVVGNSGCFDKENNIIIAGASDAGNSYQTQKPMVLKFKPNGNFIWSNVFNEYNKNGRLYFVHCDSANNIYTNGQTDTLAFYNNPRIITIKYNSSGQLQWLNKEPNRTTTMAHFYGDFQVDASGNCYLTGFLNKTGVDDDWITTKYNNAGIKKWSVTFNSILNGSDKPIGLAVDKKGNVYVAGYTYHTAGNFTITTVAYSKTGSLLGSDIIAAGKKSNSFATGIGIDKNNNIYTGGTIGIYDYIYPASIVAKYRIIAPATITEVPPAKPFNELKLFPNPVINTLSITFNTSMPKKNYILSIHDISGNTVLSKQLNNTVRTMNLNIDVSRLKAGVYTANISDGFNTVSKNFIKE